MCVCVCVFVCVRTSLLTMDQAQRILCFHPRYGTRELQAKIFNERSMRISSLAVYTNGRLLVATSTPGKQRWCMSVRIDMCLRFEERRRHIFDEE